MNIEQKFGKALNVLRELRPFYSALYEVMNRKESKGLGTMAVTTTELLYDPEFVDKTEFDEFMFILLHEICHVALMHVARMGSRDQLIWNIACDYFVNKVLSEEFGINKVNNTFTVHNTSTTIKFPNGSLFFNDLDTTESYIECIYEILHEQGKENGYFDNSNQDGIYEFNIAGDFRISDATIRLKADKNNNSVYLNGNEHKNDLAIDRGKDEIELQSEANKIVTDAIVRVEMSTPDYGYSTDVLGRLANDMIKSKVDWRKLFKKYLIASKCKDTSFSRPDKRMYYAGIIYPGQIEDESNKIKGVKVCIDTSGSISDTDLAYFTGQVDSMCKQFKVSADIINWDTSVESVNSLDEKDKYNQKNYYGGGGTDPSVLFEYFNSKECKEKPIVTLIFTDGYFDFDNLNKYRNKYKSNTIWVMTRDHADMQDIPFGKVVVPVFDK